MGQLKVAAVRLCALWLLKVVYKQIEGRRDSGKGKIGENTISWASTVF